MIRVNQNFREFLRKIYILQVLNKLTSNIYEAVELVILKNDLDKNMLNKNANSDYSVIEFKEYDESILDLYIKQGRSNYTQKRIKARFSNGLRFYILYRQNEIYGSTWVSTGKRFVDEMGCYLIVDENNLWLRDIFVDKNYRSKGVFSIFLNTLIRDIYPDASVMWSDTSNINKASLKAHEWCGFKSTGYVKAIHIARFLLIKRMFLDPTINIAGYRQNRKFLITGYGFRKYVNQHIA